MRIRKSPPLVLILAATACGGGAPVPATPLAELIDPGLSLFIHEDGTAQLTLGAAGCISFQGTATQDGQPMRQTETGTSFSYIGIGKGLIPGQANGCAYPEWALNTPLPDEPVTEIALSDDSATFSVGINHLGARREFQAPPAPLQLRWGQQAALQWSVPTDVMSQSAVIIELVAGGRRFRPESRESAVYPTFENGAYTFTLLPAPPDGGPAAISDAVLEVTTLGAWLGIDHCQMQQPGACRWNIQTLYSLPVQRFPVTVE